jgi:hypothetical protein
MMGLIDGCSRSYWILKVDHGMIPCRFAAFEFVLLKFRMSQHLRSLSTSPTGPTDILEAPRVGSLGSFEPN